MNAFYLQVVHRKDRETNIREEGKAWVAFTLLMLLLLMILSTVLNAMISNLCAAVFLCILQTWRNCELAEFANF
jgi:uncharacterized membrane protein